MTRPLEILAGCVTLLAALTATGCGGGMDVETTRPRRGPIDETVVEPARTRLAQLHVVSMPVDARISRITLEPGDAVKAGQTLVEVDLVPFTLDLEEAEASVRELEASIAVNDDNRLEETAKLEVAATVEASEEALRASTKQVEAQQARAEHAARELERLQKTFEANITSSKEIDEARLAADTSAIEHLQQVFYEQAFGAMVAAIRLGPRLVDDWIARKQLERQVLVHQLGGARVRLELARHRLMLARSLVSPVDGVVLEKREQGESALAAGTPLLVIGDLAELEAIADLLTQDALRLEVGGVVKLDPGGGQPAVTGKVRRIEPAGYTKLSALGVEQQRVNVIVGFDEPPVGLGAGFRVQARFIVRSRADALLVPRFSVLSTTDGSRYVMLVDGGRLGRRMVEVGLTSDLAVEIVSGLTESDVLVAAPDALMQEGERVRVTGTR